VVVGAAAAAADRAAPTSARGEAAACKWRTVVAGPDVPTLTGVVALSPRDVWAVGSFAGIDRPVIQHWDGRRLHTKSYRWKGRLSAVAASSPKDIWAVGQIGQSSTPDARAIAVHGNGQRWTRTPLPRLPESSWLSGVASLARDDAWAVGGVEDSHHSDGALMMHWNGRGWRADVDYTTPQGTKLDTWVTAIDGRSAIDVWAVGAWSEPAGWYEALVLRWDGRTWREVSSPTGAKMTPDAIDIAPSGEVWTLNSDLEGNREIVRWSGPTRRVARVVLDFFGSPLEDMYASDIAAVSPSSTWIVGETYDTPQQPIVAHWNGRSWRLAPTPFNRLKNASLNAVDALSGREIWAVGKHLIARYSC
jgi:hypothetical protein